MADANRLRGEEETPDTVVDWVGAPTAHTAYIVSPKQQCSTIGIIPECTAVVADVCYCKYQFVFLVILSGIDSHAPHNCRMNKHQNDNDATTPVSASVNPVITETNMPH